MSSIASEDASRRVAEGARQTTWNSRGFLKEIFLGGFHFEWIDPFPSTEIRPEAQEFLRRYRDFLEHEVDSAGIDSTGEYPPRVLSRLKELGAFGMKVDKAYGGLGFNAVEYTRAIELTAQYDANILALLSAHQSIGVPQPLALFGTEEQRRKYLPRCAAGAISAFALTELTVGSDPAHVGTTARRTPEGDYVISGEKLWCTNGTIAELFVVMAKDPDTDRISAFIVEASFPGVEVVRRCHFMGLRAIENGVIRFSDVRVPRENLVGREGDGLKIALVTLNTGRLSLPAACVGMSKRCAEIVRRWSSERVQWGKPIGRHEAVAHKLADILASTYAMESLTLLSSELSMREGYDIRLEAAAAKEWASVAGFDVVNETMQIRGGRGYETEESLAARGEVAYPVERMMRDCRINLIFEGSSEIMHLFMAREAVDRHLQVAGVFIDPKASLLERIRALPRIALFYLSWYPLLWIRRRFWSRRSYGDLAPFLRFCEASSRRLARAIFHGMMMFRAKLELRQAFLFRLVDIANEIFAMSAAISRARHLARTEHPAAESAAELATQFCSTSKLKVSRLFFELFHNDDDQKTLFARQVLEGRHHWLELVYSSERTPMTGSIEGDSRFPIPRSTLEGTAAPAEAARTARRSA